MENDIVVDRFGNSWFLNPNSVKCPYCGNWHIRNEHGVLVGNSISGLIDCEITRKFQISVNPVRICNSPTCVHASHPAVRLDYYVNPW